jgi:hypothetical protein
MMERTVRRLLTRRGRKHLTRNPNPVPVKASTFRSGWRRNTIRSEWGAWHRPYTQPSTGVVHKKGRLPPIVLTSKVNLIPLKKKANGYRKQCWVQQH